MKKIMFNDKYGLTQAVLEGRKTMTRRIIRLVEPDLEFVHVSHLGEYIFHSKDCIDGAFPRYKIGEEVAVAQAYSDIPFEHRNWKKRGINLNLQKDGTLKGLVELKGWDNKMFVRADAMPHHIRITDIKVERLKDISSEDCLKEGVSFINESWCKGYEVNDLWLSVIGKRESFWNTPQEAFAALIDKVSGKGTWKRNPWVFAYEFKLVK